MDRPTAVHRLAQRLFVKIERDGDSLTVDALRAHPPSETEQGRSRLCAEHPGCIRAVGRSVTLPAFNRLPEPGAGRSGKLYPSSITPGSGRCRPSGNWHHPRGYGQDLGVHKRAAPATSERHTLHIVASVRDHVHSHGCFLLSNVFYDPTGSSAFNR